MTTDEQLTDLLAERASQGSRVRPTMDGVQDAIARRARRRHRQRVVGSGLAALCVVAGIAGGFALAGGDDDASTSPVDAPTLPAVPLLGVDVAGLTLTEADRGPLGATDTGGPLVYAVFTDPSGSIAGPVITAGIDPDIEPFEPLANEDGIPIDLDGDAVTDGPGDGRLLTADGGVTLIWLTADGRRAAVGGTGITEDDLLAYVDGLDRASFDVRSIPAPEGLSHRELVTIPTETGAQQAFAQYEGQGGSLLVLVMNDPGWFDLIRTGVTSDSDGAPEQIPLGPSPLGTGTALLGIDRNTTTAIAHTDSGLAVQITAFDLSPDVVRDILADGRFIEIEPTKQPGTSAVEPVTPTTVVEPVTTTSVVGGSTLITDVTIEPGDELDRVEIFFADAVPADYELTTSTQSYGGDCDDIPDDGGSHLILRLAGPAGSGLDDWDGITLLSPDPDGAVQGLWSCGWFEGAVYIAIDLNGPGEAETSVLPWQPVLVVDVHHPLSR
jgi:hypothetical protein